eukprot:2895902-Lingulodinium_polyedra.AAC.1
MNTVLVLFDAPLTQSLTHPRQQDRHRPPDELEGLWLIRQLHCLRLEPATKLREDRHVITMSNGPETGDKHFASLLANARADITPSQS